MSQFRYPKTPDDPDVPSHISQQFAGVHRLHGSGSVDKVFPGGAQLTGTPWPRETRSKRRHSYDQTLVTNELRRPPKLVEADPRFLHATQPRIRRDALEHYMGDQFQRSGVPFADRGNVGNKFPVIYERDDGMNLLLSGHHRATAALIKGEPLHARRVRGPWGGPR